MLIGFTLLFSSSCTIEGEEICGIWNANGDYGEMQIEITPWKGKFLGYLLAYKNDSKSIKGNKKDESIFITDLALKDGKYQNGKIYLDPNSKSYCGLSLTLIDKHQLKAVYDCDGQISEEIWYRKGYNVPQKSAQKPSPVEDATKKTVEPVIPIEKKKVVHADSKTKISTPSPIKTTKPTAPQIEGDTKKQSTFYIIGIQEIVKYEDNKAMEKALESLWTKAYNDDFSTKLKNMVATNNMYVSYSNYDKPKGKMTITLGYKVKDLSSIPQDLKGVKIPTNDYLVYPLSGEKSDFEGEGWEQLSELIMYRDANSADFEVYTFDDNLEVKKGEIWIAIK